MFFVLLNVDIHAFTDEFPVCGLMFFVVANLNPMAHATEQL